MFWLTSKGLYGLAAVYEIAAASGGENLSIKKIARAQAIPEDYLRQLLVILKRGGFIKSARGRDGGYTLARPAGQLRVKEIVEHLEGPLTMPRINIKDVVLKSYLAGQQKGFEGVFLETIEGLVAERRRQCTNEDMVYHI